jgi:hypothetical protein
MGTLPLMVSLLKLTNLQSSETRRSTAREAPGSWLSEDPDNGLFHAHASKVEGKAIEGKKKKIGNIVEPEDLIRGAERDPSAKPG